MNDKKITIIILGILILLFGTQFCLQRLLLPSGQPLTGFFQDIIRFGEDQRWPEAKKSALKLEAAWVKYKYLNSLNYAEEDYSLLKDTILRVSSAIRSRDQSETITQARAGQALWLNFLKFIPEP